MRHRTGLLLRQIGLSLGLWRLFRWRCFTVLDQVILAQIPFNRVLPDDKLRWSVISIVLKEMRRVLNRLGWLGRPRLHPLRRFQIEAGLFIGWWWGALVG